MLFEFIFLILIDLIIKKVPAYTVLPNWKQQLFPTWFLNGHSLRKLSQILNVMDRKFGILLNSVFQSDLFMY